MNAHTTGCDRQRIDAFLESDYVQLEDAELLEHLGTCDACRAYIESLAATPDKWRTAADLLRPTPFDQASTYEFSAATFGHQRVEQSTAIRQVLDLLSPSEDPHRLGRLGDYEISGVIGAGGMGVVLKAVDPALDRVVAIKVMAPHLAHNGTARKRFAREAKAAAAIMHPNVIPIHSVSSEGPLPYLVMAYIRGGSLKKRLDREGPLTTTEILRIGSQIAAGLAAAHEQGLVHRDIKPENILLEDGVERVALTDFGLARTVDDVSVTIEGTIAGTPQYMSPEQARGESVDQKSDLFSLGSVLYTLCTGRPPFRSDTSYGVMRRISDETPAPIREINPDIPEWLCYIVEKLMSKQAADRFESAGDVHKLLEQCLSHVQQPTLVELPSWLGDKAAVTRKGRSITSFLTSKTGVFTMFALLAAGVFAVVLPTATQPVAGEDLQQLQGAWDVIAVTEDGDKELTADEGPRMQLHIKGKLITAIQTAPNGEKSEEEWGRIELNSKTNPKSIDIISTDNPDDRMVGIYEIEDGVLKICFLEQSNIDVDRGQAVKRPTTFESTSGSNKMLIECRRTLIIDPDLKLMQGDWNIVRGLDGGKPLLHDGPGTMSVKANVLSLAFTNLQEGSERVKSYAKLELERGKPFNAINFYDDKGTLIVHGIYEFKGETLRLCLVDVEDGDRPESFASPQGTDILLLECQQEIEEGLAGDLKRLQGDWNIVRGLDGGKPLLHDGPGMMSVEANVLSLAFTNLQEGSERVKSYAKLELERGKPFNAINFYDDKGTLIVHGIYEFKGETLRLCLVEVEDGDRPESFASPQGSNKMLIECRRVPDVPTTE